MKDAIRSNINEPKQLERMYRNSKGNFKREFKLIYPEIQGSASADFWNERLNYESDDIHWGTTTDFTFVIIASLLAGILAKFPAFLAIDEDFFYPRNLGFIIFPFLAIYFAWKHKSSTFNIAIIAAATIASVIYINLLPETVSDTLILSCIHLPLFLWSVLGFAFTGSKGDVCQKRMTFLKYNGDLVVMAALIVIAGGILTGITIGLFSLIGFNITEFYFEYIGVFGLAAAPIVATHLTQTNPQLVGKVSPVIAKLFSPLVLVMLVIYLIAIAYSGKDPYNDREFLLLFNSLLIGVMAIIFFSIAESSKTSKSRAEIYILLTLSIVTILVNGVAISAILFRIAEWGITPNRISVLGANALILVNLLLVSIKLYNVLSRRSKLSDVGMSVASYLPLYVVWTIIVTFLFPLLFGFN